MGEPETEGLPPRCPACGEEIQPDDPGVLRAVEVVPVPDTGEGDGDVADGFEALFHVECFGGGVQGFRRL